MRRMWSGRTIAAAALLVAACATPSMRYGGLEDRVHAVLEQRALGPDALRVIDNLLEHGSSAPPATPRLVRELLARPLDAADAARIFREAVPPSLAGLERAPAGPFEDLLKEYLAELAEAQRLLRAGIRPWDDDALLRALAEGLPSSAHLLALGDVRIEQANALFIEATARFASRVRDVPLQPGSFESAIGTVVIGTRGNDRHGPGAALIIDPGGDDVYERAPARGGTVSVIVDLAGNDRYEGSDVAIGALSAIVELSGDDRYDLQGSGLGAAVAGVSLLLDFAGNDSYAAKYFGLGAAAFGFGALVDLEGDDTYRIEAWGEGFGLAGGTGLLWDRRGNDRYVAGGIPDAFERGAGLSGAQGAGFGARGRLGGGVGILRDDQGDDAYEAQMFAQGSGYYYALGLLWDRAGADKYQAHRYAQGNAAHQAVGVLRDDAGDDSYSADWYAQGMGLDLALGVLFDAAGADSFSARGVSQGSATANGLGLLVASAGRFSIATDTTAWGEAQWLRGLPSVGVLLYDEGARFTRIGKEVDPPGAGVPPAVQPPTPQTCPSPDPGEALVCRVLAAADLERTWRELTATLPDTELAGWIAVALAKRPPSPPQAEYIATTLSKRTSCNVRALALRAWPTITAAHEGVRSSCYRLQAAALAGFARLGERAPPDAALPSFLRALPPQDDTF